MKRTDLNRRRWRLLRLRIIERDGHRCTKCGRAGRLEVDHIRPVADGGEAYDESNLRTLCRSCHIERHAVYSGPEFRAWREVAREHR